MSDLKTWQQREYSVTKSNHLIQKTRYELSVSSQKMLCYILSLIKPNNDTLEYSFYLTDYFKVCGISTSGTNYSDCKKILKDLRDSSFWLEVDGKEVLVSWLSRAIIYKGSGLVKVAIDSFLVPYLYNLRQKFTQYQLYNILTLKSSYSIRIYEILLSYTYQKSISFSLDEFRRLLMIEDKKAYSTFRELNRMILQVSKKEINMFTNIMIDYDKITQGRKVIGLTFYMKNKDIDDRCFAMGRIEKLLG